MGLSPDFVKLFTIFHKEVLPCETYLNSWLCNEKRLKFLGEQGFASLMQTGAELMHCYGLCFSIHWHFVLSFVYHTVSGLVSPCCLNQIQVI